jgi:predicted NBD/HSP70 family sugar kinase
MLDTDAQPERGRGEESAMRYYLTEQIGGSFVVVGEVIGGIDPVNGSPFPHIMGEGGLTREQLLELPGGRRALWEWERCDNSAWAEAYAEDRHESNISNVRELAAAGNPFARDLITAGFPEPDVSAFLRGDRAFPDWRPEVIA